MWDNRNQTWRRVAAFFEDEMAKSYWMVVTNPENFQIARERQFDMVGLQAHHRRKVQRMEPGDRVLLYIAHQRCFGATTTVTVSMVEDHSPVWKPEGGSDLPFRVGIRPEVVLDPSQYIDADQLAPRLDYTRRWVPELWFLAFQDSLHLISKYDFNLVEEEMRKIKRNRRPPPQPRPRVQPPGITHCKLDEIPSGPEMSQVSR